jgi:class 3 adenylate cyclase
MPWSRWPRRRCAPSWPACSGPPALQQRQVTVLFADMVGSTAMAQGLDAEDTLAVLGAALKRMADIVQAHQGRVLRFTGDGVKAVFGMDAAREDDAERAVRAGLAILQAASVQAEQARRLHGIADLAFRVGLHTGSVALGAGVEADNTAVGAAVNIAARMEQSAAPGTLRISQDTWSQVRGLFDMQEQPPLQVKGVEAPMQTYLVRAALDRSTASVERGLRGLATPMMGRDVEFQRLLQAVAQARQTRQLQALTLLGDAGLGKSRMLRELTAVLRAESAGPGACRVITLRSQPDGQLRLWGLMRSLLAAQCGVADTDSAEVARRKVVEGLSPCFDERGERQAQLIGQLSGLDFGDSPHVRGLDPRGLRDQAFNALRGYLQSLARERRAAGADHRRPALGRRRLAGPAAAPGVARGRVAAGAGHERPACAAAAPPRLGHAETTCRSARWPRRRATRWRRRCCGAWTRCLRN